MAIENQILALLMALGISAEVLADENGQRDSSELVIPVNTLKLHYQTRLIIEKLKALNALSIIENESGAQLIVHGSKLDRDFFAYLRGMKNLQVENEGEMVFSDELAAALAKFGELDYLAPRMQDQLLLENLQRKIGPGLDEIMKAHAGASFA